MKVLMGVLALISWPALAEAPLQLIDPAPGQDICYYRIYSAAHLKTHPGQKIKAVCVTYSRMKGVLYSGIEIRNLAGKKMTNAGTLILSPDGKSVASMDGDGGKFQITQDAKQTNKVQIKIISPLRLEEDNWMINEKIPEGTSYEKMVISEKSEDAVMNLERGIGKSCTKFLDN